MRIALGLEYDGSGFSGWEAQHGRRTVQECVERALSRIAAQPVRTVCAGRTDAGVHALAQVVHFDTGAERPSSAWTLGTNTELPSDVSAVWSREVDESFHARFSARRRRYRYVIHNRALRSAVWHRRATWVHRPLAVDAMRAGAAHLVGEHDFSAFRATACQARNPVRTVYSLDVERDGELVRIDVCANAFLHHMVRNIAGALLAVGTGRRRPDWVAAVRDGRDRRLGGVTASPDGLYLVAVEYEVRHGLPQVPRDVALW